MKLPTINAPQHTDTLPLSKIKLTFRPFLVSEEKILLMAMEEFTGQNPEVLLAAVKQIIRSCILSPADIDIDTLPNTDIEWLFLQVRKMSLGPIVEVNLVHNKEGCGESNKVTIDLNQTKVVIPEGSSNILNLTANAGVKFKYPQLGDSISILDSEDKRTKSAIIYDMLATNIDQVFDGDEFAPASDYKKEELIKWIETWTPEQFKTALDFFGNLPFMSTQVTYTCSKCHDEVSMEVRGSADFFI